MRPLRLKPVALSTSHGARENRRIRPVTYVVTDNCIACKDTECVEVCRVYCF